MEIEDEVKKIELTPEETCDLEFDAKYNHHAVNLHLIISDYCKKKFIPIYDRADCSYDLLQIIKDCSSDYNIIYNKIIKEDVVEKEEEEEEEEYYHWQ